MPKKKSAERKKTGRRTKRQPEKVAVTSEEAARLVEVMFPKLTKKELEQLHKELDHD